MRSEQSCFHWLLQMWKNLGRSLFSCFWLLRKKKKGTQSRYLFSYFALWSPWFPQRSSSSEMLHFTVSSVERWSVCGTQSIGRTCLWLFTGKTDPPWGILSSAADFLSNAVQSRLMNSGAWVLTLSYIPHSGQLLLTLSEFHFLIYIIWVV